jgi:hypothetical protein
VSDLGDELALYLIASQIKFTSWMNGILFIREQKIMGFAVAEFPFFL